MDIGGDISKICSTKEYTVYVVWCMQLFGLWILGNEIYVSNFIRKFIGFSKFARTASKFG